MIKLLTDHKCFYILWFLFIAVSSFYLFTHTKGELSLWASRHHTTFGNIFFSYVTWLGDGLFIAVICISLLFVKYRYAIVALAISIIVFLIIMSIKSYFNEDRPSVFFEGTELNYVPGIVLYKYRSFPSGHTSGAFCIYLILAVFARRKLSDIFFFLLALAVAFSRVYLMQHFLIDVVIGSVISVVVTSVLLIYVQKPIFLNKQKWMNHSLLLRQ